MITIRDIETANRLAALILGFIDQRPEYTREVLHRQAIEAHDYQLADDLDDIAVVGADHRVRPPSLTTTLA